MKELQMTQHFYDSLPIKSTYKFLKILYIEDEDTINENITKILKYFTSNVVSCKNAEDALKLYEEIKPDIIISDINLPGMSGLDFVKRIREFDETSQIFLLSAYTEKEYLFEAIKLNLVDYLTKPINFDILSNAINKAAANILKLKPLNVVFENGASYCYQEKVVTYENTNHNLTSKETKLLDYLIKNNSRLVSKDELLLNIWDDEVGTESALKALMNKLRNKIGKEVIENISGLGYKLRM